MSRTSISLLSVLVVAAAFMNHGTAQDSAPTDWPIVAQTPLAGQLGLNGAPNNNHAPEVGRKAFVFRTKAELHAAVLPGQIGADVEKNICKALMVTEIDWGKNMLVLARTGPIRTGYISTLRVVGLRSESKILTVVYEYVHGTAAVGYSNPAALVLVPKHETAATRDVAFIQAPGEIKASTAPGGVTLTLGVDLRGKLAFADKQVTVRVLESKPGDPTAKTEVIWALDLASAKALLIESKALDGKDVVVTGTCRLLGIKTETRKYKAGALSQTYDNLPWQVASASVLDLERIVRVQALKADPAPPEAPKKAVEEKKAPSAPIKVEIEADKAEYDLRAPIQVTITYTNTSKDTVVLLSNGTSTSGGFPGETFTVTTSDSGRTSYVVQAVDPAVKRVTIEPGKSWKRTVALTELLCSSGVRVNGHRFAFGDALPDPFGRPDEYTVRLSYRSTVKNQPAPVFNGQIDSNAVKFKVVKR